MGIEVVSFVLLQVKADYQGTGYIYLNSTASPSTFYNNYYRSIHLVSVGNCTRGRAIVLAGSNLAVSLLETTQNL